MVGYPNLENQPGQPVGPGLFTITDELNQKVNQKVTVLTQAEYDTLPSTKLNDGRMYFIKQATSTQNLAIPIRTTRLNVSSKAQFTSEESTQWSRIFMGSMIMGSPSTILVLDIHLSSDNLNAEDVSTVGRLYIIGACKDKPNDFPIFAFSGHGTGEIGWVYDYDDSLPISFRGDLEKTLIVWFRHRCNINTVLNIPECYATCGMNGRIDFRNSVFIMKNDTESFNNYSKVTRTVTGNIPIGK